MNSIDILIISASPSVDLIFVVVDGISHVIILFLQVFVLNLKVFQVGRLIVDRIGHLNSALVLNPLQILFLLIQHVQSLDLHFKVIHQLSVFVLQVDTLLLLISQGRVQPVDFISTFSPYVRTIDSQFIHLSPETIILIFQKSYILKLLIDLPT